MKFYTILFLILVLLNFFGLTNIQEKYFILFTPIILFEYNKQSIYKKIFSYLIFFLFINIFLCYIIRNQNFIDTLQVTIPFFFILFYFVLKNANLSIINIEKLLLILSFICCFAYLIQYFLYPVIIFNSAKAEYLSDDNLRLRLTGQGIVSYAYFYSLSNIIKKKNLLSNMILLFLSFIIIFLMGFRTMLFFLILFSIYIIYRNKMFNFKFILLPIILFSFLISNNNFLNNEFINKINSINERQQIENFNNSDYIRLIQLDYFVNNHFNNFGEYLIGSGVPYYGVGANSYGKKMKNLENNGINWVDWGLLSLSWIIGLPAVLMMIFYSFKVIFLKLPKDYIYIKVWFLYLLSISLTTMEFFRPGNFIIQAIVLLLAEKIFYKNNFISNKLNFN